MSSNGTIQRLSPVNFILWGSQLVLSVLTIRHRVLVLILMVRDLFRI